MGRCLLFFSRLYMHQHWLISLLSKKERENIPQCPCIMHNKWERERERGKKKNPSIAVIGTLDGTLAVRVSNWKWACLSGIQKQKWEKKAEIRQQEMSLLIPTEFSASQLVVFYRVKKLIKLTSAAPLERSSLSPCLHLQRNVGAVRPSRPSQ